MTARAPIDALRALPPPLQRRVLARMAAEQGPEAVAALRWQVEAHRRPAQALPGHVEDLPPVLVITGEYGTGKTQLATWLTLRAILEWNVHRPRLIAATKGAIEDTVIDIDGKDEEGGSGLYRWLPPWIPREYQTSTGYSGKLTIAGRVVTCISAEAGANAIGSPAGWVLFDDYAKCVEVLGASKAEAALVAAFKSLRAWPGKMILPTTPDGAEMVLDLATETGTSGVEMLDLGHVEENLGNLAADYRTHVKNLRAINRFVKKSGGAFSRIEWPKYRIREGEVPPLRRAIVFVDPAKSQRSHACKVGIVATGIDARATVYGLADKSDQRGPDGPKGWPAATLDLAEDIERRFRLPEGLVELGIECNTLGEAGPELLRAEERNRNAARGKPAVSTRKIHKVTSRPRDPKTRRAAPVVALCEGNQVRMVVGLGELESSLSGLTDAGTKADAADAFVHGARVLAGLGDEKAADQAAQEVRARAAFHGLGESAGRMPRVEFDLDRA